MAVAASWAPRPIADAVARFLYHPCTTAGTLPTHVVMVTLAGIWLAKP